MLWRMNPYRGEWDKFCIWYGHHKGQPVVLLQLARLRTAPLDRLQLEADDVVRITGFDYKVESRRDIITDKSLQDNEELVTMESLGLAANAVLDLNERGEAHEHVYLTKPHSRQLVESFRLSVVREKHLQSRVLRPDQGEQLLKSALEVYRKQLCVTKDTDANRLSRKKFASALEQYAKSLKKGEGSDSDSDDVPEDGAPAAAPVLDDFGHEMPGAPQRLSGAKPSSSATPQKFRSASAPSRSSKLEKETTPRTKGKAAKRKASPPSVTPVSSATPSVIPVKSGAKSPSAKAGTASRAKSALMSINEDFSGEPSGSVAAPGTPAFRSGDTHGYQFWKAGESGDHFYNYEWMLQGKYDKHSINSVSHRQS